MKRALLRSLVPMFTAVWLIGCANPGPPLPPSLELPLPVADLHALRKGDQVYLTWTVPPRTVDHQNVRHLGPTRICRAPGTEITNCSSSVGEVSPTQFPVIIPVKKKHQPKEKPPKVEANYTDHLPSELHQQDPLAVVTYAVSVFNSHNRTAGLSNRVQVPAIPALRPPANFHAQVTSEGVVLSWSALATPPETSDLTYLIRIYRRPEGGKADAVAAEVPIDSTTFTDHGFEWEKNYEYRATTVTLIPQPGKGETSLEGDDTTAAKVIAHDIFPPAVPSGLQAIATGVGQQPGIDLVWSPDTEADLAGYNVYRHESGGTPVKINRDLVKIPSFRDTGVISGRTFFYSISAVDVRGNESARCEEAHETLP
jgi:hypothetical protein